MRVVIDTNVSISAVLKNRSTPADARPRLAPLIPVHFRTWLEAVMETAELVRIGEPITVCRDPKDDKFLELAVHGRAELIVSGDADLLALNPFRGIPIVTPTAFMEQSGH